MRVSNPYPNRTVGIRCRARPDGKQPSPSEKMKMPRDGARVPRCSKKASAKQSTIKCFGQPSPTKRRTNLNHNFRVSFGIFRKVSWGRYSKGVLETLHQ